MISIGSFDITSGTVLITDPCYEKGTWCTGKLTEVKTGTWTAFIKKLPHEVTGWGERVSELIAIHCMSDIEPQSFYQELKADIGVDSGQAGIFDETLYQVDFTEPYAQVGQQEYHFHSMKNQREETIKSYEQMAAVDKTLGGDEYWQKIANELRAKPPYIPQIQTTTNWYEICCDKTLSNLGAGVVPGGCVSSSGFGDGGYTCLFTRDSTGLINRIKIVFISDKDLSEDKDEEFDDDEIDT